MLFFPTCKINVMRLALTMGDVAGVGPEILARVCANVAGEFSGQLVIIGDASWLQAGAEQAGVTIAVPVVSHPAEFSDKPICCWDPGCAVDRVASGQVDAQAGQAACDYLNAAIDLALEGLVDGIVTAPLNKLALHAAGVPYPGHTEILAARCGVDEFSMMLHLSDAALRDVRAITGTVDNPADGLGIAHVTLHTSVESVPSLLTLDSVFDRIVLMRDFLANDAAIGVCALNPHAGESGLFGDEELRIIQPAIARAQAQGIRADGPFPADTLVRRAVRGEFGGVVAMYHDQGHIPFKLIGFERAVNITLGLPIIRTSPSHGTAFDIAGQGRASAAGMWEAIRMAEQLVQRRSQSDTTSRE